MKSMLAPESQTLWPSLRFVYEESDSYRVKEIRESVACRAYELFEERGRRHGHDLEDWLSAESESLLPIAVKTCDFEDMLIIHAEIPLLTADDLEVCVQRHRIIISDKVEVDSRNDSEPAKRLLHIIALPGCLDWESAATAFKDGVLEIEIPKLPAVGALEPLHG